jgi:hypothetical protein
VKIVSREYANIAEEQFSSYPEMIFNLPHVFEKALEPWAF